MAELTRRYIVMQMAAEGPFDIADPDAPFVLKPWKDPAALQALIVYRQHCYPELAAELNARIRAIEGGPKIRGGVGSRNELTASARRKPRPGRAQRPTAKRQRKQAKSLKKKSKRSS